MKCSNPKTEIMHELALLILFRPLWPLCFSSSMFNSLPKGLCTYCFFYLEHILTYQQGSLFLSIQAFLLTLPFQGVSPNHANLSFYAHLLLVFLFTIALITVCITIYFTHLFSQFLLLAKYFLEWMDGTCIKKVYATSLWAKTLANSFRKTYQIFNNMHQNSLMKDLDSEGVCFPDPMQRISARVMCLSLSYSCRFFFFFSLELGWCS